jgi:protein TonB
MTARHSSSFLLGTLVALTLFFLMQWLVGRGKSSGLGERRRRVAIEFVRARQDSEIQTKQRERPERVKPQQAPPPPAMDLTEQAAPDQQLLGLNAPDVQAALSLDRGRVGTPGGGADMDVIPLVRVNPQYPPRAQSAGIEGWVHLRFTVTAQGTTADIQIVDADPKGYFEQSARKAVEKYKYKPRIENGSSTPRPGVEVVLAYKLRK